MGKGIGIKGCNMGEEEAFCNQSNALSVQGMLPYLPRNGMADKITVHETLESTNVTARELAMSGAEHGTAVIADRQSAGRGWRRF